MMGVEDLLRQAEAARNMAGVQPMESSLGAAKHADPSSSQAISPEDLAVMKERFPNLCQFSDQFLQTKNIDQLLRLESTSMRIKESERSRETEDRLANNKAALHSKFYMVPEGKDNRCTELHPARYLPGAACSAARMYIQAREVIGLSSPPQLACYDLNAVGMGGYVTARGWLELGTSGSSKLKVGLFNINNAAKSGKSADDDSTDMKSVGEFVLALRTLRTAAQFVCPWNLSYLAIENFFLQKEFMKDELRHDDNPAKTLCQFTDFVISKNSGRWRDGSSFIYFGEMKGYWDAFVGARPQSKASNFVNHGSRPGASAAKHQKDRKQKSPRYNICGKFNTNTCQKQAGSCVNFKGIPLQHVCNWRDLSNPASQPCGQNHARVGNH